MHHLVNSWIAEAQGPSVSPQERPPRGCSYEVTSSLESMLMSSTTEQRRFNIEIPVSRARDVNRLSCKGILTTHVGS